MKNTDLVRFVALGGWVVCLIGMACGQAAPIINDSSESSFAQLNEQVQEMSFGIDSQWMIVTGALVFFMQAGFAVLEAGAVSKSDTRNILLKNLLDVCVVGLGWWGFGFAFAFGNGESTAHRFIGNRFFFSDQFPDWSNSLGYAFWYFEFGFCACSATIVSGAVAERANFQVYIMWALIHAVWVYPVVVHWEWSGQGWLSATNTKDALFGIGMIDFAGCGAVHSVGGGAALVGAIVSGMRNKHSKVAKFKPRFERIGDKWVVNDIPGKSDIFSSLGVLILWFAWYGFNCGSTLRISSTPNISTSSRIAATTTLATCSAGLSCVLIGRLLSSSGNFNINDANNGLLAGLVSITAPCAVATPWGAVIIGAVGAAIFKAGSFALLKLRIDDPVDAAPLHLGCGIWGLLSSGLFADQGNMQEVYGHSEHFGLFMGGGGWQLAAQIIGAISVASWTIFWACCFWIPVKQYDRRLHDRIFFIKEDVTGGVDQRFITAAHTLDLHSNLAELGSVELVEMGHQVSFSNMSDRKNSAPYGNVAGYGSSPPGGKSPLGGAETDGRHLKREDSTVDHDSKEDLLRYVAHHAPTKRKAFLEFLNSLPDDI